MSSKDIIDEVIRLFGQQGEIDPIFERVVNPESPWDRFQALRELYAKIDTDDWDPYLVDWTKIFTPIEADVWGDLRRIGIQMWPQYPAGRYFLDFADPRKQIAIECDGKDWHTPERDAKRDNELMRDGWRILRIPGRECRRAWEPDWEDVAYRIKVLGEEQPTPETVQWLENTSEGLVHALGVIFYGCKPNWFSAADAERVLSRRMTWYCPPGDE